METNTITLILLIIIIFAEAFIIYVKHLQIRNKDTIIKIYNHKIDELTKRAKLYENLSGSARLKIAMEKIDDEVYNLIPNSYENWRGIRHIGKILGMSDTMIKKSISRLVNKNLVVYSTVRNNNKYSGSAYKKRLKNVGKAK